MSSNPEITKSETDGDFEDSDLTTKEIIWNVQNLYPLPERKVLKGPSFAFQNATWCLRLVVYPSVTSDDYFYINIVRLTSRVSYHRLRYCFIFMETSRHGIHEFISKEITDSVDFELLPILFFPRDQSYSMKVTCILSCYKYEGQVVDVFSQAHLSLPDAKDVGAFCQSFKNIFLNGENHDVVVKVKDKEFRAHRDVLRARSPVLECMLSQDMIEKNRRLIDIPDCDPSAFQQFLLYSGEVETLDAGNMLSLYYIADKYDSEHLKGVCRQFVKESLSTSNVTDVVQIALDHSDADLLRWSTDYFVREINEILPTVEWMSFLERNPVQANELFIRSRKSTTDDSIKEKP